MNSQDELRTVLVEHEWKAPPADAVAKLVEIATSAGPQGRSMPLRIVAVVAVVVLISLGVAVFASVRSNDSSSGQSGRQEVSTSLQAPPVAQVPSRSTAKTQPAARRSTEPPSRLLPSCKAGIYTPGPSIATLHLSTEFAIVNGEGGDVSLIVTNNGKQNINDFPLSGWIDFVVDGHLLSRPASYGDGSSATLGPSKSVLIRFPSLPPDLSNCIRVDTNISAIFVAPIQGMNVVLGAQQVLYAGPSRLMKFTGMPIPSDYTTLPSVSDNTASALTSATG